MVYDLHNDLPTSERTRQEQREHNEAIHDFVIYAFWTTASKNPVALIKEGIQTLNGARRKFAIEDLGFVAQTGTAVLREYAFAYCGLTHNSDNSLAGGALGDGRLTFAGREVVSLLNALHIPVDAAHLSRNSFYEVAELADRIIDSHTGWESFHPHPRNLTDRQVQCIIERGGIIGLTAVKDFIGGSSINEYACLIDAFVQKFGIKQACIGTDFYGTQPLDGLCTYSDFDALGNILSRKGYTETDLNRLFFENADQYFNNRRTPHEPRNL